MIEKQTCWVVTEGMAGTENQCLGVAEALGIDYDIKRIQLRQPWKALSPTLRFEQPWTFKPAFKEPWPDLLLAAGRKSIAASRYIKKASAGKTFTVQIQDPRIDPAQFDLVAVPHHDPARGKNVIVTDASPNRVTLQKLEDAKKTFAFLGKLPSPRVAVLIGGNSKAHKMTASITKKLAFQLVSLDAHLMVTTSRRTGAENTEILKQALLPPLPPRLRGGEPQNHPPASGGEGSALAESGGENKKKSHYFWNGVDENPYFGMLAWADHIIVTSDSASMLSDAGTTGKPVYRIPLEGGSPRFDRLHQHLDSKGITRVFDGRLETWTYQPLHDAYRLAEEIRKHL